MESTYLGYYLEENQNGGVDVYATIEEWRIMNPTYTADNEFRAKKFIEDEISQSGYNGSYAFNAPMIKEVLHEAPIALAGLDLGDIKTGGYLTSAIETEVERRDSIIKALEDLGKANMMEYLMFTRSYDPQSGRGPYWVYWAIAKELNIADSDVIEHVESGRRLLQEYWRSRNMHGAFTTYLVNNINIIIGALHWNLPTIVHGVA